MAIISSHRKPFRLLIVVVIAVAISYLTFWEDFQPAVYLNSFQPLIYIPTSYDWSQRAQTYPVDKYEQLPSGKPHQLPRVQHDFANIKGTGAQESRRREVKRTFKRDWDAYKRYAWGQDELNPVSLTASTTFAGWGATLVDSLDALWILGLKPEFHQAVRHVATIDWADTKENKMCSLFETNIRYLGGLLAAYDLSNETVLLQKATELGEMLYNGFDTPNRMPANAFHFERAKIGQLTPSTREISANVGSLSLEFTRLSQMTGNPKYYDAIERVKKRMQASQFATKLPGMWPVFVDVANNFLATDSSFTLGSMADSLYEYLPKMWALLGGLDDSWREMYTKAIGTAKTHLLFRPMLPPEQDIDVLFSGNVHANGAGVVDLIPQGQHLTCFVGGMFALGGKLFSLPGDVDIGAQLTRGCAWAYDVMPTHVMPEEFTLIPCHEARLGRCEWDEGRWEREGNARLPKGFSSVHSAGYMLRPEAIESVFYMWRITGDEAWRDVAWDMFRAVSRLTTTGYAHSTVRDVTRGGNPEKLDTMEVSSTFFLSGACLLYADDDCTVELLAGGDLEVLLPHLLRAGPDIPRRLCFQHGGASFPAPKALNVELVKMRRRINDPTLSYSLWKATRRSRMRSPGCFVRQDCTVFIAPSQRGSCCHCGAFKTNYRCWTCALPPKPSDPRCCKLRGMVKASTVAHCNSVTGFEGLRVWMGSMRNCREFVHLSGATGSPSQAIGGVLDRTRNGEYTSNFKRTISRQRTMLSMSDPALF